MFSKTAFRITARLSIRGFHKGSLNQVQFQLSKVPEPFWKGILSNFIKKRKKKNSEWQLMTLKSVLRVTVPSFGKGNRLKMRSYWNFSQSLCCRVPHLTLKKKSEEPYELLDKTFLNRTFKEPLSAEKYPSRRTTKNPQEVLY